MAQLTRDNTQVLRDSGAVMMVPTPELTELRELIGRLADLESRVRKLESVASHLSGVGTNGR